jgi:hypothetical protein
MPEDQNAVLKNYLLLIAALMLPMMAFYLMPAWALSICSIISIGLIWLVARGSRLHAGEARNGNRKHLQVQRWVILIILLGGILGSLQVFLAGEQLRARFSFAASLWFLTWVLWIGCASMAIGGCISLLYRKQPGSAE